MELCPRCGYPLDEHGVCVYEEMDEQIANVDHVTGRERDEPDYESIIEAQLEPPNGDAVQARYDAQYGE